MKQVRIETRNEAAVFEMLVALQRMADQMPNVKVELQFNISKLLEMMVYPEREKG